MWEAWADWEYEAQEPKHEYYGGAMQYEGMATYYSPGNCDSTGGGETAADGTHVYFGMVANSVLPLGTNIEVSPPIMGRTQFTVHDRFGSEQEVGRLDVWLPCGESIPNPYERFRVVA